MFLGSLMAVALFFSGTAIFCFNAADTMTIGLTVFSNGIAQSIGGSVYTDSCSASISSSTFNLNTAADSGMRVFIVVTFYVMVVDAPFLCPFHEGGAAAFSSTAEVHIQNSLFEANSAGAGSGGAILFDIVFVAANITDCQFTGNSAGANGGAIHAVSVADLYLQSSSMQQLFPTTKQLFGVVRTSLPQTFVPNMLHSSTASSLLMSRNANLELPVPIVRAAAGTSSSSGLTVFSANTALLGAGYGGAVSLSESTITVVGAQFNSNLAKYGGAIAILCSTAVACQTSYLSGTYTTNNATSGYEAFGSSRSLFLCVFVKVVLFA